MPVCNIQPGNPLIMKYSGYTFMIVDDEMANIILLQHYLRGTGAIIIIAKNGFEAVEKCRMISNIHLILMDIRMPVMNGFEATRRIKSFCKVLVIAISAFMLVLKRNEVTEVEVDDYIEKPYSQQDLIQSIDKHLHLVN